MSALEQKIAQVRSHRHAGRIRQAEQLCIRILKTHPDQPDALAELSLLALAAKQYDLAALLLTRAIQTHGPTSLLCLRLAEILCLQGKTREATACLRQALEINPLDLRARLRLAQLLLENGQSEEARQVAAPLVGARPHSRDDAMALGALLFQLGFTGAAGEQFQHAVTFAPNFAPGHYNLGVVCMMEQRLNEAEAALRQAIACDPDHAPAFNNLGVVLHALGRIEESLDSYRAAVRLDPNYVEAWYNLGQGLQGQGRLAEAVRAYERALATSPSHADAWNNLGNTLLAMGEAQRALECYARASQLRPQHREAHFNLGVCQLLLGDLPAGWRGYEHRFFPGAAWKRFQEGPRWQGDPLGERRLLLFAEQGIGDVIQFSRLACLIPKERGQVVLECHPPLARLLATLKGVDEVVPLGAPLPPVDCQLPLLSLPAVLALTLEAIPNRVPYVRPDPLRVAAWAARLRELAGAPGEQLRVGLVWAGNPHHQHDRWRSLPFAELAVLAGIEGVLFLSLQFGPRAADARRPPPGLALLNLEDELGDFADTAALMENLDLLVSVDTASAHLAGALGRPVWTMLAFSADWRWMLHREDTPWYPTMRLIRQPAPGDWRSVLLRVRRDLEQWVARARAPESVPPELSR